MTFLRAFKRHQGGAAATEMALVIPLLLVIMFGGLEAGHYFYTEQKIIKAVREGARYAGRLPFSEFTCSSGATSCPTGTECSTTRAAEIQEITRTGLLVGGTPLISNWSNTDIKVKVCRNPAFTGGIFASLTDTSDPSAPLNNGAFIVTVSATAKYPSLFESLGILDSTRSVNASAQAAVMGI